MSVLTKVQVWGQQHRDAESTLRSCIHPKISFVLWWLTDSVDELLGKQAGYTGEYHELSSEDLGSNCCGLNPS